MSENKPSKYNEKYCEYHKHYYAGFLSRCPICFGEFLASQNKPKIVTLKKEEE